MKLEQGDLDYSASAEKLGFSVTYEGHDEKSLKLQLNFENPVSVSAAK